MLSLLSLLPLPGCVLVSSHQQLRNMGITVVTNDVIEETDATGQLSSHDIDQTNVVGDINEMIFVNGKVDGRTHWYHRL